MVLLSITGFIRTLLIVLGVLFLLQVLGKTAQARRNVAEERKMKANQEAERRMKEEAKKNYGKTSISKVDKNSIDDADFTDFEEIDD